MWKPGIYVSVFGRGLILAYSVSKVSRGLGMVNVTTTPGDGINRCFGPTVRNLALGFTANYLTKLMPINMVCLYSQYMDGTRLRLSFSRCSGFELLCVLY